MHYCTYCGNNKVEDQTKPCPACNVFLTGPLTLAHKIWLKLSDTDRRCCGRLDDGKHSEAPHLFLHCKYWECSYPDEEGKESTVTVECGVSLYESHARPYYIYDTDGDSGGVEFGDNIPLPTDPDDAEQWDTFYNALHQQLSKAAEMAFNDDWYTCETCGYHASCAAPHEHEADEPNE